MLQFCAFWMRLFCIKGNGKWHENNSSWVQGMSEQLSWDLIIIAQFARAPFEKTWQISGCRQSMGFVCGSYAFLLPVFEVCKIQDCDPKHKLRVGMYGLWYYINEYLYKVCCYATISVLLGYHKCVARLQQASYHTTINRQLDYTSTLQSSIEAMAPSHYVTANICSMFFSVQWILFD